MMTDEDLIELWQTRADKQPPRVKLAIERCIAEYKDQHKDNA